MKAIAISAEEYQLRYEKIQQFLEKEGLGALLAYSPPMEHKWGQTGHVSYLSGWANHDRIIDTAVVIPAQGQLALLFSGMEFMREQIAQVSPLGDVRLVQAVDPNAISPDPEKAGDIRSYAQEILAILKENGLEGGNVGIVSEANMPVRFHQALIQGLGERFRPVTDIVSQLRSVKAPTETEIMRRAAELSDLGFKTMLEVAKPGMRGIEIIAEMERAVRREGADHAKYWMASGPPPDWSNSQMDVRPHLRVLHEGDLMGACSYICYKGYWCHGQRSGVLQRRCAEFEEICRIARESQDAGLDQMVPAKPVRRVAKAIREKAAEHGWKLLGGRVGHGIGMDYSERPLMAESSDDVFEVGTTAVIHAVFTLPDSGKMFVPLGDVCVVTEDGPDILMKFPRTPFVAGE